MLDSYIQHGNKLRKHGVSVFTLSVTVSQHISYDTCIAAHSRPCTATSQQIRHACLHHFPRFFLAQVCKHRLASVFPTLDCSCRSDHVVVDWSCWNLPHWSTDRIRSSARTRAFLISTFDPDMKTHHDLSLWLRAVYLWRANRLSKSSVRDN